jgi:hypothetical protein
MFDQFNKWTNEEIAISWRDWLNIRLSNVFEIQIYVRKDDDETYNQTLINSLNDWWLNQH